MTDGPVRVVVVQCRRGERWVDFSFGTYEAALRMVNQNTAGVWRGVRPVDGEVVIEPRVHEHAPLFGVVTDSVATCECGQRITLVEGTWETNWPRREDDSGIQVGYGMLG